MMSLKSCLAKQSWVNREYSRVTKYTSLKGPSVKDQRGRRVVAYPYHLGAALQEVQDPVAQGGVQTQCLKLNDEFGGYHGVEY